MTEDSGSEGCEDALVAIEEYDVKVKIENSVSAWVPPLYAKEPILVFDGKLLISRKTFESMYALSNRGKSPKKLKIGKDCTEAEVERWFGPVNGKNAYHYNHHDDEEVCKEIERIWMICHQKTVVPGVRTINKAEARGFTCMKKDPPVLINWAVFGEWCIRDRIWREQRVARKQSQGLGSAVTTTVHLNSDTNEEENPRNVTRNLEVKREFSEKRIRILEMPHLSALSQMDIDCLIREWSDFLVALEDEVTTAFLSLEGLKQTKDQCSSELLWADAQLADWRQMLETASAKFQQLEAEVTVMRAEVPENSEVPFESLPAVGPVLRKLDAQAGVVDAFSEMLAEGEVVQEKASEKARYAVIGFNLARESLEVLGRQREAVKVQLGVFKSGQQLDIPLSRPRQCANPTDLLATIEGCCVISHLCAFCDKSFEPEWDCKVASCKHGYHSWCANVHFATTKHCCFKDCGEEMHPSWCIQSGYKPGQEKLQNVASTVSNEEQSSQRGLNPRPLWNSKSMSPSVGSKGSGMQKLPKQEVTENYPAKKQKEVETEKEVVSPPTVDAEGKHRQFGVKKGLPSPTEEPAIDKQTEDWSSQGGEQEGSASSSEPLEVSGAVTSTRKMKKVSTSESGGATGKGILVRKLAGKQKKTKILIAERISTRQGHNKEKPSN